MPVTPDLAVHDLPLAALSEWPRNPRRISRPRLEQLKRALAAEPEMLRARPLIALPDGTVVAGNQRLRAARELGWLSLPVVTVDLEPARAQEWALRDNQGYGEDDEQAVGALLAELAVAGRDLDLSGYGSAEVDRLLALARPVPPVDPDEAPPVPAEPRSRRGEVYELGAHRLMCGDASSAEDVGGYLRDEKPALCITDPPYGLGNTQSGKNDYANSDDLRADVAALAKRWLPIAQAHMPVVVFSAGVTGQWLYPEPDWVLCWFYGGGQLRSQWGYNCWQPFLCYGKDPSLAAGRGGRPDAVDLNVPANAADLDHPCPKPVALLTWLIERLSFRASDVIFDPFAGAGTTLIAAEMAGRRCLAMEIDPAYCDVIRARYAAFTNQPHLAP